jgi:hypothetical protein
MSWLGRMLRKPVRDLGRTLRPRLIPQVPWLAPLELVGSTRDGRVLFFPLERLSHITSLGTGAEAPDDRPAVLHLTSGDFYTMEGTVGQWMERVHDLRTKMLSAAFAAANEDQTDDSRRDSQRAGRAV